MAAARRDRQSKSRCPRSPMAKFTWARRTSSPFSDCNDRRPAFAALHALVIRPATALGGHPVDDLIRIGDVAGLAVYAVREVDLQPPPAFLFHHFVDGRRAKILARAAVFENAAVDANVGIENMQVARLIFFVARS